MTPEEITRQTHGDISLPDSEVATKLQLPCHVWGFGSDCVTEHTYSHVMTNQEVVDRVIFQYTFEGCAEIILNGKRYDTPQGKAFLAMAPSAGVYQQHPDAALYDFVFIVIGGDVAISLAKRIIQRNGPVLTLSHNSRALRMLCEHLNQRRKVGMDMVDFYAESVFGYDFLITLLKEQSRKPAAVPDKIPEVLETIAVYIEKHLGNGALNVEMLAEMAGFSRFHFARLFKKYYGLSPKKYLVARRIYRAMQLLMEEPGLPFKAVIMQCGFSSESYFCNAFRKLYHDSPGNLLKHRRGRAHESEKG